MKIDCVLFDLDNTLYPEKDYFRSILNEFSKLHPEVVLDVDDLILDFDIRRKDTPDIFGYWLRNLHLSEDYRRSLVDLLFNLKLTLKPYKGVSTLFKLLNDNSVRCFVLTNGFPSVQLNKWNSLDLEDKDQITFISARDVKGDKPNSDTFEEVKERMSIKWENLLAIGDNFKNDLAYPISFGANGILIKGSVNRSDLDHRGIYTVNNFNEASEIVNAVIEF